jgi:hypothetical protein
VTVAVAAPAGCSRCASPLEHGDLRCAVCALPVPAARAAIERPRVHVLRCTWCGAAVGFDANHQAPCCGFCGSVMAVEELHDPLETATLKLPFTVTREMATEALRRWLGKRGYFAPATLRDEAVLESLTPLCWAGWVVSADASIAWTADSDHDHHRSAWAPHAGQTRMRFDQLVVPASRGLRQDECERLAPYYNLAQAVPIDAPAGDEDVMIESFDAQRSAARREIAAALEDRARTHVEDHEVPGHRMRKVRVSCLLERQTTSRVALPAWVMAYRYRGSPYRAIVHGRRADIVIGTSPIDWPKVMRLAATLALGALALVLAFLLLTGCGGSDAPPDAPDFIERCVPAQPTFEPLTGRAAIQGILNVHVDAGGLIMQDTTSTLLLAMDLVQNGTQVAVTAETCQINIPDVPLAGQDMPIHMQLPQATLDSIGKVMGGATLASADATCAALDSDPITLVLGARLDPTMLATDPLPVSDDTGAFPACMPPATTPCTTATGTGCACDQESDAMPGATLIARNVPAIEVDQLYVALRTTFTLHGSVWSTDLVKGKIDVALDTGVLACKLLDGTMCGPNNLRTLRTLNPVITQQPAQPSTFRAVRVAAGTSCAEIIANQGTLFPR